MGECAALQVAHTLEHGTAGGLTKEGDPCSEAHSKTSPWMTSECLKACPGLCPLVNEVGDKWLKSKEAAYATLCKYQKEFACAFSTSENYGKCITPVRGLDVQDFRNSCNTGWAYPPPYLCRNNPVICFR